jgi:predicted nucleotidyltransferase
MKITDYVFLKKLCELPFIDAIWLYGSRARGDEQERSDFDIAILCPRAQRDDWLKIVEIIDSADTLLNIDYVRFDDLANISPLKKNILHDKKVLYERK